MRELLAAQQELDAEEAAAMEDLADVDSRAKEESVWCLLAPPVVLWCSPWLSPSYRV